MQKQRKSLTQPVCVCNESESINHLFFGCYVAKNVYKTLLEILSVQLGQDFESVVRLLSNKKNSVTNVVSFGVLCGRYGNLQNDVGFRDLDGRGEEVLIQVARTLRR